ncbi:structural maintenance of chromosomes protein 5 [Stigmatopora nigra]
MELPSKRIRKSHASQRSDASALTGSQSSQPDTEDVIVEGVVVRITMKNFLTYENTTVHPGQNLNMVIGANGTGKSSIVCAICLGLAGKTTLLDRDDKIGGYVKRGHDKGSVEIELYKRSGNLIINREIHVANNQSVWKLNGRTCNQKTVEEEIKALHIQINNLCQFLPQEKVGQFSKMSKIELLEATEKSVGPPEMFEYHCDLKNVRIKETLMENAIKEKTTYLEKTKQLYETDKIDENRYYQKEKHLSTIQLLEKKKAWVEYETTRKELEGVQNERDKVKKQLATLKQTQAPMVKKLQSIATQLKSSDTKTNAKSAAIREASLKHKQIQDQLDRNNQEVEDIKQAFKMKQTEEEDQKKQIIKVKKDIENLKVELAKVENQPDVTPRITEVNAELRQVHQERGKLEEGKADLRREKDNLTAELRMMEKKLSDMNNMMKVKEEKLRRSHSDTYEAVQWLRQNRQLFTGNVCEPLMLVINMRDNRFAKYLESHISFNDLRAFVFQRNDDMVKFMEEVRDNMKLRVNAIIAPAESWSRTPPSRPIESLRHFGFTTYLRETFDAPEEVMSYLCMQLKVHEIPIGGDKTESMISQIIKEPHIKVLYANDQKYEVKKSFYSNLTSTKNTTLYPPKFLSTIVDAELKKQLEQQMKVCQTRFRDIDEQFNTIEKEMTVLHRRDNELLSEKKNLSELKGKKRQLEQNLSNKQNRLKDLENSGIDLKKVEAQTKQKLIHVYSQKKSIVTGLYTQIELQVTLSMEKVYQELEVVGLLAEQTKLENACREDTSRFKAIKDKCSQLEVKTVQLTKTCKELLKSAKSICGMKPDETLMHDVTLKTAFIKLPNTLDELEAMLNEERARADCFPGLSTKVVEECKKREKEIQKLEQELIETNTALTAIRKKKFQAKEDWLNPLKQLVEQINNKFSDFFSAMQCAGEVELHIENEEEYDKYGITIRVKFHESSQLHELTQFHQSGGERSMSTMLYLMSLQELNRCPFRVVDEINQGMDPINERRAFDILVRTACKESTSQYFVITPKLLKDLNYVDEMTILIVHNGPYMPRCNELDPRELIRRLRQKKKAQS